MQDFFDKQRQLPGGKWAVLTEQAIIADFAVMACSIILVVITLAIIFGNVVFAVIFGVAFGMCLYCINCLFLGFGFQAVKDRNVEQVKYFSFCMMYCACMGVSSLMIAFSGSLTRTNAPESSTSDEEAEKARSTLNTLTIVDVLIDVVSVIIISVAAYSSYQLYQTIRYGNRVAPAGQSVIQQQQMQQQQMQGGVGQPVPATYANPGAQQQQQQQQPVVSSGPEAPPAYATTVAKQPDYSTSPDPTPAPASASIAFQPSGAPGGGGDGKIEL